MISSDQLRFLGLTRKNTTRVKSGFSAVRLHGCRWYASKDGRLQGCRTTPWMEDDSMDGGGRVASGTVTEVESRREQ